jgi:hypothetical protein
MKRLLISSLPAILLLFLIASCGKEISAEEDLGQYYLKCKIGSADKTFNIGAAASKVDVGGGLVSYAVSGRAVSDPNNFEGLDFAIQLSIPLAPGSYKVNDPTTDYFMAGIYNPNTTDPEKVFASIRYDEANPFQITFTEITTTTLSGTFKGKLYLNNTDPNADSAVISNGSFKLKFQK